MNDFDVIVIGSGHAGIEAGTASARMGSKTLMITMNVDQIGTMSCNPAIGGLGKSQLAREVDALGGLMCRIADETAMQYRLLNENKGPAVQASRVQVDRHEYRQAMKAKIERYENLSIKQGQVTKLILEQDRVVGVETSLGQKFFGKAIVITTGTFMNGKAHIGRMNFSAGRAGDAPSVGLSDFLRELGIKVGRLKTGTVPRVDARTIDFSKVEEQVSQPETGLLSFYSKKMRSDLVSAHITYTNSSTHDVIRASLEDSPLYSGIIKSRGPRYCPSVEDKVVRYPDRERHQIFLEREGRQTEEVYVGGLSTSLPYQCQVDFLRTIPGLENVEIIRPGYAIEYDFIDSTQLSMNLELRQINGLFFAGQVNGTSGYEEAAAQGIYAGINASLKAHGLESYILKRSEAYIGVMVDDLVTRGTDEPYRMFTSRAEWRLLLRQDNAHARLSTHGYKLGVISDEDYQLIRDRLELRTRLQSQIEKTKLGLSSQAQDWLKSLNQPEFNEPIPLCDLIRRPLVKLEMLKAFDLGVDWTGFESSDLFAVESDLKYSGYLRQVESQLRRVERLEAVMIPKDWDYQSLSGLPLEAREKLSSLKPQTLAQASQISGITSATVSLLAIHLSKALSSGFGKNKISLNNPPCNQGSGFDVMKTRGAARRSSLEGACPDSVLEGDSFS